MFSMGLSSSASVIQADVRLLMAVFAAVMNESDLTHSRTLRWKQVDEIKGIWGAILRQY